MLTKVSAKQYADELHPAFAGYLHDGEITTRDALATVFHCMKNGLITPIFEDNLMTKRLVSLRRTRKAAEFPFEHKILDLIFSTEQEVTVSTVGELIRQGSIQKILKYSVMSIRQFPIIEKELSITLGKNIPVSLTVNGETVSDLPSLYRFRNVMLVIAPFFYLFGILGLLTYWAQTHPGFQLPRFLTFQQSSESLIQGPNGDLAMGLIFVLLPTFILYTFYASKKKIIYQFEQNVVPLARKRYEALYEFLVAHPLLEHRFNNEYLPFAIAFGIDTSWNRDFGLSLELSTHGFS